MHGCTWQCTAVDSESRPGILHGKNRRQCSLPNKRYAREGVGEKSAGCQGEPRMSQTLTDPRALRWGLLVDVEQNTKPVSSCYAQTRQPNDRRTMGNAGDAGGECARRQERYASVVRSVQETCGQTAGLKQSDGLLEYTTGCCTKD